MPRLPEPELTLTQRRLLEAMTDAVATTSWEAVPHDYAYAIRWSSDLKQCEEPRGGWTGPYTSYVFVNLIGRRRPLIRVCHAPWTDCRDMDVTYKHAFTVIDDPASELRRTALSHRKET